MLWDFNRNTVVITHSCVDAQINRQLKLQEDHVGPEDEVNKAMVMFIEVKERRETRDWVDWSECIALQLHQEHVKQVFLIKFRLHFVFVLQWIGRAGTRSIQPLYGTTWFFIVHFTCISNVFENAYWFIASQVFLYRDFCGC